VPTAVVTGSASGIGAATAARLRELGHRVITVDVEDADINADLGDAKGRQFAIEQIGDLSGGVLDVVVTAAGVGPTNRTPSRLAAVNYFGSVAILGGLRPLLAARGGATALAISSNTITCHPNPVPEHLVVACLDGAEGPAAEAMDAEVSSDIAYPISKIALSRWVRRQAVTPDWIGAGIRLNALVPGMTDTPMLAERFTDDRLRDGAQNGGVPPIGRAATPDEVAAVATFLLSAQAALFCGALVFCDGGTDALTNQDGPAPLLASL
jgi:NAD(P)-dependent dehydrogenase (short-subunit alcohol dehydrogenase family)